MRQRAGERQWRSCPNRLAVSRDNTLPQVQVSPAHHRVQRELGRHRGSFPTDSPGNRVQVSVHGPHIWSSQEPFLPEPLISWSSCNCFVVNHPKLSGITSRHLMLTESLGQEFSADGLFAPRCLVPLLERLRWLGAGIMWSLVCLVPGPGWLKDHLSWDHFPTTSPCGVCISQHGI